MDTKTILLALALTLTGCHSNTLTGHLSVAEPFTLRASDGRAYPLVQGTYRASATWSREAVKVTVHTAAGRAELQVPGIPEGFEGELRRSAAELGQEFSVEGTVVRETGALDRVVQVSCFHHYETRTECGVDGQGHPICHSTQEPVYGLVPVRETGTKEAKVVRAQLERGHVVGWFEAEHLLSVDVRHREYVGYCEL